MSKLNEQSNFNPEQLCWENAGAAAAQAVYQMRRVDDAGEMLECATLDALMETLIDDGATFDGATFDALVVTNAKIEAKAKQLGAAFNRAGAAITVAENGVTVTKPFKKNSSTQICMMFEMTDGQTITVFLHNPDAKPNTLQASDVLISWKWLLNRKDITIVVAKEHGKDLAVAQVAARVMALVDKNAGRFAKANAGRAARMGAIAALEGEVAAHEATLKGLIEQINAKKDGKTGGEDKTAFGSFEPELFAYAAKAGLVVEKGQTFNVGPQRYRIRKDGVDIGYASVDGINAEALSRGLFTVGSFANNAHGAIAVIDKLLALGVAVSDVGEGGDGEADDGMAELEKAAALKQSKEVTEPLNFDKELVDANFYVREWGQYAFGDDKEGAQRYVDKLNSVGVGVWEVGDSGGFRAHRTDLSAADKELAVAFYRASKIAHGWKFADLNFTKQDAIDAAELLKKHGGKYLLEIADKCLQKLPSLSDDFSHAQAMIAKANSNGFTDLAAFFEQDAAHCLYPFDTLAQIAVDPNKSKEDYLAEAAKVANVMRQTSENADIINDMMVARFGKGNAVPESAPIVLTGKELGDFPDTPEGKKALREAAKEAFEGMRGKRVKCPALNADVEIRKTGIKKVLSFSADARKLQIIPKLDQLIGAAEYVSAKPNYDIVNTPNIKRFHTLMAKSEVAEKVIKVRFVIGEDNDGAYHYDHSIHDGEVVFDGLAHEKAPTEVEAALMGGSRGYIRSPSTALEPSRLLPSERSNGHQVDSIKPHATADVNDLAIKNTAKGSFGVSSDESKENVASLNSSVNKIVTDSADVVNQYGTMIDETKATLDSVAPVLSPPTPDNYSGSNEIAPIKPQTADDVNATFDAATGKMVLNLFLQIKDENGNWVDLPDEELEDLRDFPAGYFSEDEFTSMAESYGFSKVRLSTFPDGAVESAGLLSKNGIEIALYKSKVKGSVLRHGKPHKINQPWFVKKETEPFTKYVECKSLEEALALWAFKTVDLPDDVEPQAAGGEVDIHDAWAVMDTQGFTAMEFAVLLEANKTFGTSGGNLFERSKSNFYLTEAQFTEAKESLIRKGMLSSVGSISQFGLKAVDDMAKEFCRVTGVKYENGAYGFGHEFSVNGFGQKLLRRTIVFEAEKSASVEPQAATTEATQTALQNEDVAFLQSIIDGKQSEAMASPDFADKLTDMYARVQGVEADLALFNSALQVYTDFVLEATK